MMEILYIVVPCYNEQEMLPETEKQLCAKLQRLIDAGTVSPESRILLVNDGSKDNTWPMICEMHARNPLICGMTLSRNRGHQNALLAGLFEAEKHCDCCISIDADLQDDIEVFDEMLQKHYDGADIVYGKRLKREGETLFKKVTAAAYYRLLSMMSAYPIPLDTGDFRLIDRRVADVFLQMREHNRFLRGMSAWMGFASEPIEYERHERAAGSTKYTLKKMLRLAMDGITGFSDKPLTISGGLGIGTCALAGMGLLALVLCAIFGVSVAPWLWAVDGIVLLQGLTLCCMGLQGMYLGRMYDELKGRPLYIVAERINID